MPVTRSTTVVQTLESVVIHQGGAVDVGARYVSPDYPDLIKSFSISATDALPFWSTNPSGTVNRWEDLCGLLYNVLITRGDITGVLS